MRPPHRSRRTCASPPPPLRELLAELGFEVRSLERRAGTLLAALLDDVGLSLPVFSRSQRPRAQEQSLPGTRLRVDVEESLERLERLLRSVERPELEGGEPVPGLRSPGNWITARSRLSRASSSRPAMVSMAARTSSGSGVSGFRSSASFVRSSARVELVLLAERERVVRGAVGRLRQPDRPGEQAGGQERDDRGDDAVPLGPPPDPLGGRLLERPARVAAGHEARATSAIAAG